MAVKTTSIRNYVSDISGRELSDLERVRVQAKSGDGRTWILDAHIDEAEDFLSHAKETTGMGRQNGNGNSYDNN